MIVFINQLIRNKKFKIILISGCLLINPVIEILSNEIVDGWEGYLSVPDLRGLVPRYKKIKHSSYDIEGRPNIKYINTQIR
jgi:peptide deformylase